MRMVLKFKSIHDIYNANKKKEGWSTQKPTTAPYEEPNQSTKSNNDEPSPMYNLTQSQRFMVFAFSFLCFFFNPFLGDSQEDGSGFIGLAWNFC